MQEGLDRLTFAELDPISTDHPIFVLNASGHLAYANSKAFEVSCVSNDVEDPPGGEFVRDADGNLTGFMKNNVAYLQVTSKYPALAEAEPVEALIRLLDRWGAVGLTTVSELSLGALSQSPADAQVMAAAAQSGRLNARIRAYPFYTLGAETWDEAKVRQKLIESGDVDIMIAPPFTALALVAQEVKDTAIGVGALSKGPVILLQHGNPTWSFLWRKVIRLLAIVFHGERRVDPALRPGGALAGFGSGDGGAAGW